MKSFDPSFTERAAMIEDVETVAKFWSLPEAEACRMRLESEGLTVYLTDAETIRADWLLTNAVGSVKVQVPLDQVSRAKEILQDVHLGQTEHDPDEDYCLACGAIMEPEESVCSKCGWTYQVEGADLVDDQSAEDDVV